MHTELLTFSLNSPGDGGTAKLLVGFMFYLCLFPLFYMCRHNVFCFTYRLGTQNHDIFKKQGIPGPKPLPFLGTLLYCYKVSIDSWQSIMAWFSIKLSLEGSSEISCPHAVCSHDTRECLVVSWRIIVNIKLSNACMHVFIVCMHVFACA